MGQTKIGRMMWIVVLLALLLPLGVCARTLTEADFVREFIARNPQLAAIGTNPSIARQAEREFLGQFDSTITAEAGYLFDQSAESSIVFGTDNRQLSYGLGVEKRFPIGLGTELAFKSDRYRTNSTFISPSTYYEPVLSLEARQQLLQNSFGHGDRKMREALRMESAAVSEQSLYDAERALTEGLVAYWQWVTEEEGVQIAKRFLESAQEFEKAIENRAQLGTAEETDRLAALSGVLERKNDLLMSETALQRSQNAVRALLLLDKRQVIRTAEDPAFAYGAQLDNEIRLALLGRRDLIALKREVDAKALRIEMNKNKMLPLIDLTASLELNGLSADYTNAVEDSFQAENPSAFAGLEFRFPIENRAAKSAKERDVLAKKQLLFRIQELESRIVGEVDSQYRDLSTRLATVETLKSIHSLQEKKWEQEQAKFFQGRSTSDTVIRYDRERIDAKWRLLEAKFLARIAWIRLRQLTGDLWGSETP